MQLGPWDTRHTSAPLGLRPLKIPPSLRLEPRAYCTRESGQALLYILSALDKGEPQALPLQITDHLCRWAGSREWLRADVLWVWCS